MNEDEVMAVLMRLVQSGRPADGGRGDAEKPKRLDEMSQEDLAGLLERHLKVILPEPFECRKECNPFKATLCRHVRRSRAMAAIGAFARTYARILRGE